MTVVMLNNGEIVSLEYLVNRQTSPENLVLRLFQNDVDNGLTQSQRDALDETDFTEATFTGYSSKTLTGASWSTTSGNPTEVAYAQQEFVCSADVSPQTIYGYYLTRATTGDAVAYEKFSSPRTVEFTNDTIRVTPKLTAEDTQD